MQKNKSEYDVNRMISWFNESYGNEGGINDDLISLDDKKEKKEGWSKSDLLEPEEKKQLRRDKQTSLLGSVVLLMCA